MTIPSPPEKFYIEDDAENNFKYHHNTRKSEISLNDIKSGARALINQKFY